MPLTSLQAEKVGPFDRVELDFSDGHGNPHLGPHVIAGVNGSGKSTVLLAIASCFGFEPLCGFPFDEFGQLAHTEGSVAHIGLSAGACCGYDTLVTVFSRGAWSPTASIPPGYLLSAGYSPSRILRYVDLARQIGANPEQNALSFVSTVGNVELQRWWLDLFTRIALSDDQALKSRLSGVLLTLNAALEKTLGEKVSVTATTKDDLSLAIEIAGKTLNMSQIPDGVRNMLGWLADFLRRREQTKWAPEAAATRPSVLLIDEIDAHLHPRWQRRILPALKKALPDVQIIVTTHSPFVISSCPGARIHVLERDEHGIATARPAEDAPVGASITAMLRDIFGVDSRFDVETEQKLDRWNTLRRKMAAGKIQAADKAELDGLTTELSATNEELAAIVSTPPSLPKEFVEALLKG